MAVPLGAEPFSTIDILPFGRADEKQLAVVRKGGV